MSDIKFDLKPVEKRPSRKYRKGSKYDSILNSFLKSYHSFVQINVENQEAHYLKIQLNKRIKEKQLSGKIKVSVVNNVTYLEKV